MRGCESFDSASVFTSSASSHVHESDPNQDVLEREVGLVDMSFDDTEHEEVAMPGNGFAALSHHNSDGGE